MYGQLVDLEIQSSGLVEGLLNANGNCRERVLGSGELGVFRVKEKRVSGQPQPEGEKNQTLVESLYDENEIKPVENFVSIRRRRRSSRQLGQLRVAPQRVAEPLVPVSC
jgi:hypothetical protein